MSLTRFRCATLLELCFDTRKNKNLLLYHLKMSNTILKALLLQRDLVPVLNTPLNGHEVVIDDIKYTYELYVEGDLDFRLLIQSSKLPNDETICFGRFRVNSQKIDEIVMIESLELTERDFEAARVLVCIALKVLVLSGHAHLGTPVIIDRDVFGLPEGLTPEIKQLYANWGFSGLYRSVVATQMRYCDDILKRFTIPIPIEKRNQLLIQGPVCAYKLHHEGSKTQFLLFGDYHDSLIDSEKCAELPWYKWLQNIFEPNIPKCAVVDVLLESIVTLDNGKPSVWNPVYFQGHLFGTTLRALHSRLAGRRVPISNSDLKLHSVDTRFTPGLMRKLYDWALEWKDSDDTQDQAAGMSLLLDILTKADPTDIITLEDAADFQHWKKWSNIIRKEMLIDDQWDDVALGTLTVGIRQRLESDTYVSIREMIEAIKQNNTRAAADLCVHVGSLFFDEYTVGRSLREWNDQSRQTNGRYIVIYAGTFHIAHIAAVLTRNGFQLRGTAGIPLDPRKDYIRETGFNYLKSSQCLDYVPLMPFFDWKVSTTTQQSELKRKRLDFD